ncbi:MAG: glycosyltransferase family 39 protein [Verrucomicrobiota bacterium]
MSAPRSDSLPSDSPAYRPRLGLYAAVVLAVLHLGWLGYHLAPAIMSPDANGYVVQARLMAEAGRTSLAPSSPVQYIGMHWLETEGGTFHSRYPAGLPVLFAAAWKLGGLGAALWVNPLLASATLLLVFLLARRLVSDPYALVAAAVVATVPVTNQHALDADAHIAATFFLVAGVLALLRFAATRGPLPGILAGVLLGAVPAIRYPEAIVGVTLAAWLLWRVRPVLRLWPAVLGAALPIAVLCGHNTVAYGAFWRTGYALTNEQTGFGFGYFFAHALPYLQALGGQGLALMFAFGVAGIAALGFEPRRRPEGLLFAGLVVPLVLLYMAYYFGGGGMGAAAGNLRFLIPTFPFIAVAGVWLLARFAEGNGAAGRAAVVVVVVLQLIVGLGGSVPLLLAAKASLAAAARVRGVAEREIPAGSVVIVERQLAESLDAAGRWKLVDESLVGGGGFGPGGTMAGREGGAMGPERDADDAPSPMQRGKNRAQQERYSGLTPRARRDRIWSDVITWAGEKPVFWLARSVALVDETLPAKADYRTVATVPAPMMMGPGGGGGPNGGPPGMMPGRGAMPGRSGPAGGPGLAAGRRGGSAGPAAQLRMLKLDLPKN